MTKILIQTCAMQERTELQQPLPASCFRDVAAVVEVEPGEDLQRLVRVAHLGAGTCTRKAVVANGSNALYEIRRINIFTGRACYV